MSANMSDNDKGSATTTTLAAISLSLAIYYPVLFGVALFFALTALDGMLRGGK